MTKGFSIDIKSHYLVAPEKPIQTQSQHPQ